MYYIMDTYIDLLKYNTNNKVPQRSGIALEEIHKGGASDDGILPGGGFPPLYECIREEGIPEIKEETKKREFGKDSSIISVYNILDNRRKTPFITLPSKSKSGINHTLMIATDFDKNIKYDDVKILRKSKRSSKKHRKN